MRNPVTGKHEIRKFFKSMNYEVVGVGDTKEEARKDLDQKLDKFKVKGLLGRADAYSFPMAQSGEFRRSPGLAQIRDDQGRVKKIEFRDDRVVQIMGRPGLYDKTETKAE